MSRTNNVTEDQAEAARKANEAALAKAEEAFKAWKSKNAKADNDTYPDWTALEEARDLVNPNRYNVAAGVSNNFLDAVRAASRKAGYTVSTFLRYHIESDLGRNPTLPESDLNAENVTISTALHRFVKAALQAKIGDDTTQADYLRTIAANVSGYDLTQEPERMGGIGTKAKWEEIRNKDVIMLDMWESSPDLVAGSLTRNKRTFASIGLKEAQVMAALEAGELSQASYDAVMANVPQATTEPRATEPEPEPANA